MDKKDSPSEVEGLPIEMDHPWRVHVEAVLDEIRPSLEMHGGGATFLGVSGKKVFLKLSGACHGCPLSAMTFGIMAEDMIRERVPDIEQVVYEDTEA